MTGRVHSIQSLGALDGPGIRFTVFLQGCNLRCGCCHNPDTWQRDGGAEYTPEQIVGKAVRYKEYFGTEGGITLSGGEPLLQAGFAREVFLLCHEQGINTCLDTSGSLVNEAALSLLNETDRALLDIKYPTEEAYRAYVGCGIGAPLEFLRILDEKKIPTTLRQVVIPTKNDTKESVLFLKKLAKKHRCVDKTELLPFRKICQVKYDKLKIPFPFSHLPEPGAAEMKRLENILTK